MSSVMERALGSAWAQLPPGLQAHYQDGASTDEGAMDIDFPWFIRLHLSVLRCFGVLINRRGQHVPTVVQKTSQGERQHWQRTMTFADGQQVQFNSVWQHAGPNQLLEYVKPYLALLTAVAVRDGQLHYSGICFVVQLGKWQLRLPEWLLGHTSIVEQGVGDSSYAMDFRLTHPWFGQVFRYAGSFNTRS